MLLSEYSAIEKQIVGKKLSEFLDFHALVAKENKGSIGQLFETQVFNKKLDNLPEADLEFFVDEYHQELVDHYNTNINVELKVTSAKQLKNGEFRAKERLVLSLIDYTVDYPEELKHSHLYSKIELMLIIYYLYDPHLTKENYHLLTSFFYNMNKHDISIIEEDYKIITSRIKNGEAHLLSGADTFYLEACTKAHNGSVTRSQKYSNIPAKQRAFALKSSFMSALLNNYLNVKPEIVHDEKNDLIHIRNVLDGMIGKTYNSLKEEYAPNIGNPKNEKSIVFRKALGVKTNSLNELSLFKKANIQFKTFNITHTLNPADGVNFFMVNWDDFQVHTWEESRLFEVLNTMFFYCYFHKDNATKQLTFAGYKFHGFSDEDIEVAKRDWNKAKDLYLSGVSIEDNLYCLKQSQNELFYIRTKGKNKEESKRTYSNGQTIKGVAWWINNKWLKKNIIKPSIALDPSKKI